MSNKVVTITECDRCHRKITKEGAEGFCPAVGWWELILTRRDEGSGWTNNYGIKKTLCPDCAKEIYTLMGIKLDK